MIGVIVLGVLMTVIVALATVTVRVSLKYEDAREWHDARERTRRKQ